MGLAVRADERRIAKRLKELDPEVYRIASKRFAFARRGAIGVEGLAQEGRLRIFELLKDGVGFDKDDENYVYRSAINAMIDALRRDGKFRAQTKITNEIAEETDEARRRKIEIKLIRLTGLVFTKSMDQIPITANGTGRSLHEVLPARTQNPEQIIFLREVIESIEKRLHETNKRMFEHFISVLLGEKTQVEVAAEEKLTGGRISQIFKEFIDMAKAIAAGTQKKLSAKKTFEQRKYL